MGNAESQNAEHAFCGDEHRGLARKHTSRSLRLASKSSRRTRHASSGKLIHRNSEVSNRSSSTPSIPQSLAENGLEPYSQEDNLDDFSSPMWADVGLRPVSYHTDSSVTPSVGSSIVLTAASVQSIQDSEEGRLFGDESLYLVEGDGISAKHGSTLMPSESFKKKRSKSADIWREDSFEFSLSDLSQEHLTSTEDILCSAEEKDSEDLRKTEAGTCPKQLDTGQRANSFSDLYSQKTVNGAANGAPRNKFVVYCRNLVPHPQDTSKRKSRPVAAVDTPPYSTYNTLPCRKSRCLSEGVAKIQLSHSNSMKGRRAKTTQDVHTGDGSEFADSGINCTPTDTDLLSRHSNATMSSYSPPLSRAFVGSESGSSSTDVLRQGVYENFRRELEMSSACRENVEEANSQLSDEQSSGTLSSPGQSDFLPTATQGTVRKAGALAVKNFLVHKKNKKVEPATRRKWKQYWVCLKGCTLFFYESDGRSGIDNSSSPKHAVWVENSIVQAVPEHPKKDFVFCLSNSLGDAFLFQSNSQTELENWITAMHSACATAVAKQHHKEDTLKLLRSEIKKVEQKIDMDEKMKKMGEMQLSSVTESKKKKTILEQVAARTGEAAVRRRTQAMSRSASKRKSRFSSLWGLDTSSKKKQGRPSINQVFGEGVESVKKSLEEIFDDTMSEDKMEKDVSLTNVHQHNHDSDIWVQEYLTPSWVCLPNDQPVLAIIHPEYTARDALDAVCRIYLLDPSAHYLRLSFLIENKTRYYIPKPEEDIYELLYKELDICTKANRYIRIEKSGSSSENYGFSLASVEEEGTHRLYVNHIKETGLAFKKGLKVGDEIIAINSKAAKNLNSSILKHFLGQPSLCLTVQTVPEIKDGQRLLQPPPRRSDQMTDVSDSGYDFSSPDYTEPDSSPETTPEDVDVQLDLSDEGEKINKSTEQVAAFCRSLHEMNPPDLSQTPQDFTGAQLATMRQLTDADKLRKVICELLETERTYVKDLNCLMERYLKPLQQETFLTQDEKVLFSLGGSFLYYADRFKLYSAFCASHTKVPKVLVKARTDYAFKAFLDAQNPKQQHSSTLESYLIKPIQRILKYPLLLKELLALTDIESEEHNHLDWAIKTMNKVASHINEMQKIHEEYGAVFDQLIAEQTGEIKEVADLSMGDLLLHTTVIWLNPPASLGKWKKDPELATFVFKTAVVLVYKDGSKQKKKLGGSHRLSMIEDRDAFRFRHMISFEALQIRSLASGDAETNLVCEIVHVKSESEGRPEQSFHLCSSSPSGKKDLLKAIQSILRDKHRRQLLKTESLPSSQQYVPFGGKRLCALKGARPAMHRAVSAPSRSLARRRRLVKNRFTIDTDEASTGSHEKEQQPAGSGGDTDRWVEEQFDLAQYEDQEHIKETDILSSDDEYCESVKSCSAENDLQAQFQAASITRIPLGQSETYRKTMNAHASRMSQLRKQSALSGLNGSTESNTEEVIWVRRDDFVPSRTLNTEI